MDELRHSMALAVTGEKSGARKLRPGWIEMFELSRYSHSSAGLTQIRKDAWRLLAFSNHEGNHMSTLKAAVTEPPLKERRELDARLKFRKPFGLALSSMVSDFHPARLRDNLVTYLFPHIFKEMHVAKSSTHSFQLTPEIVTLAIESQSKAGLPVKSAGDCVRYLDVIFEGRWPECEIWLNAAGGLVWFVMSNKTYTLAARWGES